LSLRLAADDLDVVEFSRSGGAAKSEFLVLVLLVLMQCLRNIEALQVECQTFLVKGPA
jgi:hypothetical protein